MISSNLQQVVRSAAEEFGVEAVWLFGSAAEDEASARDIDLAVLFGLGFPAEKGGLLLGDVLTGVNGRPVQRVDELLSLLGGDVVGK